MTNKPDTSSTVSPKFMAYRIGGGTATMLAQRPITSTLYNDGDIEYDADHVCMNTARTSYVVPNAILMAFPNGCSAFGTADDPKVYTVWLENMTDIAPLTSTIAAISTAVSGLQTQVGAVYNTATSLRNGMMSMQDKAKLDGFLPANQYMTKTEMFASYTNKGTVAALTDLPDTNVTNGDMYYVTAESSMYIYYSGIGWTPASPNGVVIDAITNNAIDLLFP